jgi:hypothetical protein
VADDARDQFHDRETADEDERDRESPAIGVRAVVFVTVVTWHEKLP